MIKWNTLPYKTNLLLSIFLLIILTSCKGQDNKVDLRNGISSSEITHKPTLQNLPKHLRISEVVRTIFQDSRGDIWFGTQNGAFRQKGESLIHMDGIQSESGQGITIKDITEDKNGKIWLGHSDGISSVDGDKITNYYKSDGLLNNDVWCIASDLEGNIWIGTIEGVCIFNGHDFTRFDLPEGKIDSTVGVSSTNIVHNIMRDINGTLWFSTNAGLFSYSKDKLIDVSDKVGISSNFINEINEDNEGEYWISTKEGLYHLKDDILTDVTNDKIEIGKGIGSVAQDKNGKIWFVSNQHDLYIFDGGELIKFPKTDDNKGPVVFQIFNDQRDRLWFVGYGGAYRLENGRFLHITKNGPW